VLNLKRLNERRPHWDAVLGPIAVDPDTAGILRYLDDGKAHTTRELATATGSRVERVRQCMQAAQIAELVAWDRDDMWGLTQRGKTSIMPD
jgi:hypothetical protein